MTRRAAQGKQGVSKKRLGELSRMRRETDALTATFLAADVEEPRLLDASDREALRITLARVVEAEHVFARLRVLKSDRARRDESDWLATNIIANVQSLAVVKLVFEHVLADCKLDRSQPLPRNLSVLMTEHGRVLRRMRAPGGDDNARAKLLLRLLQLEMIWFGQMW